jgi:hypothetical protein
LSSLGLFNKGGKTCCIMDREIRENLAVHFDAGLAKPLNKSAVGESQLAGCSIDALDPQGAEIALLGAPVAVGVLACLFDRLDCDAEYVLATAEIALRLGHDFLVGFAGNNAAF